MMTPKFFRCLWLPMFQSMAGSMLHSALRIVLFYNTYFWNIRVYNACIRLRCRLFVFWCGVGLIGVMGSTRVMQAQFLEDGMRLVQTNGFGTARMAALGLSYNGIADDFGALLVHPAGLTLLPSTEVTAGGRLFAQSVRTQYWNGVTTAPLAIAGGLSHLGIAVPIRSQDGTVALAFGYTREHDFAGREVINGFNRVSSLTQSYVRNHVGNDLSSNRAYRLFLADTVGRRFVSPVQGNLLQHATTLQIGGLDNVSAGVAVNISQFFAVGATLIGTFGTYGYTRTFEETDVDNVYNRLDPVGFTTIDFARLNVNESIIQQIRGVRGVVSVQGRIGEAVRLGGTITTPGWYAVNERNAWNGSSEFDNNDVRSFTQPTQLGSFAVRSPWRFGANASVHVLGLTLTAAAEYTELTTMRFEAGPTIDRINVAFWNGLNQAVLRSLNQQASWSVGAEYELPGQQLVLRGSYTHIGSPYLDTQVYTESNIIGIGAGWYFAPNLRFDAALRLWEYAFLSNAYNAGDAVYSGRAFNAQMGVQLVWRL